MRKVKGARCAFTLSEHGHNIYIMLPIMCGEPVMLWENGKPCYANQCKVSRYLTETTCESSCGIFKKELHGNIFERFGIHCTLHFSADIYLYGDNGDTINIVREKLIQRIDEVYAAMDAVQKGRGGAKP